MKFALAWESNPGDLLLYDEYSVQWRMQMDFNEKKTTPEDAVMISLWEEFILINLALRPEDHYGPNHSWVLRYCDGKERANSALPGRAAPSRLKEARQLLRGCSGIQGATSHPGHSFCCSKSCNYAGLNTPFEKHFSHFSFAPFRITWVFVNWCLDIVIPASPSLSI